MNIEWLVQTAKDILLKQGEQLPTLFCESTKQGGWMPMLDQLVLLGFNPEGEKASERTMKLFQLGRKFGIRRYGYEITFLAFLLEAWALFDIDIKEGDPPPADNLEEDPRRREALMILVMEVDSKAKRVSQYLYPVEILRDGAGNLVDLLAHEREDEVDSLLMEAFLSGWYSSRMPDDRLAEVQADVKPGGFVDHLIADLREGNKRLHEKRDE